MYTLLSALPPVLADIPYADYVQKYILDPLGLSSTTYSYNLARESGNLVDGFGRQDVNKTEDLFGLGTPRRLDFPNNNVPPGKDGNCELWRVFWGFGR
jgi:CubicO group peptidase (beta-lactamase class C family)